jgi:putative cell wall-binding protein
VYNEADYLIALKKNHGSLGIPYIVPELPAFQSYVPPEKPREPRLEYGDHVGVRLVVLKNGIVRVKVSTDIALMYEKYYRRGVQPPLKVILHAYKSHGFSPQFLEKIKKSHERKMEFAKKVPGIVQKIFDKEPVKKIKKEKKEEEDEPPESTEDVEDETLDIEPDEEEEEEIVEEEILSDDE